MNHQQDPSSLLRRIVPFPMLDDLSTAPSVTLPVDHFLNRAIFEANEADESNTSNDRSTGDSWQHGARPDTSSLAAADYDVSVHTGFLPPQEPVRRLTQEVGESWCRLEEALELVQDEIKTLAGGAVGRISESWRAHVRELILPDTTQLTTLPLLRRAHVLLSFLGHSYVHSTFPTRSTVPSSLAIPWMDVSDRLGLPPILTYADTVLWNWRFIDPSLGMTASNLAINTTFTSSPSEYAFFLLSLLCEVHAPALLRLMSATLDEAFFADELALPRVASNLEQMSSSIDELSKLLDSAVKGSFGAMGKETIDPAVFYWQIRPWFNGGRWMYEGLAHWNDREMDWGGPSAGQSSLIHAIDLFLGVDHSPRTDSSSSSSSSSSPSSSSSSSPLMAHRRFSDPTRPHQFDPTPIRATALRSKRPSTDNTYMLRATQYMPLHHRAFLLHLSSLSVLSHMNLNPLPSIRSLALAHAATPLGSAYDGAIMAMKRFRDEHMKIAARFIVTQARSEPGRSSVFWDEWERKRLRKEQVEKHTGTGGTELVTFLKDCRARTVEALLGGV